MFDSSLYPCQAACVAEGSRGGADRQDQGMGGHRSRSSGGGVGCHQAQQGESGRYQQDHYSLHRSPHGLRREPYTLEASGPTRSVKRLDRIPTLPGAAGRRLWE